MTPVASPVPERYLRGLQAWGGVAAGMHNGSCLGWPVRSSGFPLRDSHGNPRDRFQATGDEITVKSGRRARIKEGLPKRAVDQCLTQSLRPKV